MLVENMQGIHVKESLNATDLTECGESRRISTTRTHSLTKHILKAQTHT